ncbi:hypothetical protein AGMMS50267_13080 [Spirochaetia bacterium]|nr:hypothetical protein AGMMS50267_13080 [Spirochaetia bacterium]
MTGGEISGNTASSSYATYGGGVCVTSATFTKTGGIIYGSNASPATLKNTASKGANYGHTVYVSDTQKRNTTAVDIVNLDSGVGGVNGGWE